MATLNNFPNISPTNVSIYEKNGQICSLPIEEIDISGFHPGLADLDDYPDINIGRDMVQLSSGLHDMRRSMVVTVNEPPMKRIARIFMEEGLCRAISELAQPSDEHQTPINPLFRKIAQSILNISLVVNRLKSMALPQLWQNESLSIGEFSETRDWNRSTFRCIRWHPNCFKIAIAAHDDSIRVFSKENNIVPILKNGQQKNISCLAWRPYTAGELAVGCQAGILIWSLDPNSNMTRPLSQPHQLKLSSGNVVSSIEWSPNGILLAAATLNSPDITIWNVDMENFIPLTRVGFNCSSLRWSPDGSRLCSATIGNVFRVWATETWIPERWSLASGAIQSAVWSSCGSYLVFVTTTDPYIYSMCFIKENLFTSNFVPKEALPIADLTKTSQQSQMNRLIEVGGRPQSIAWCPRNRYLAVSFMETTSIAIFNTNILNHSLNITPACFLTGIGVEYPSCIAFQPKYRGNNKSESILTIAWSSGRLQYFPFV